MDTQSVDCRGIIFSGHHAGDNSFDIYSGTFSAFIRRSGKNDVPGNFSGLHISGIGRIADADASGVYLQFRALPFSGLGAIGFDLFRDRGFLYSGDFAVPDDEQ